MSFLLKMVSNKPGSGSSVCFSICIGHGQVNSCMNCTVPLCVVLTMFMIGLKIFSLSDARENEIKARSLTEAV